MKFFAIFQSFREGGFIRSFFLTARRTNPERLPFLLTPRPCGHLPYILRCKTQRRRFNTFLPHYFIEREGLHLPFSLAVFRSITVSCVSDIGKTPKNRWFLRRGVRCVKTQFLLIFHGVISLLNYRLSHYNR